MTFVTSKMLVPSIRTLNFLMLGCLSLSGLILTPSALAQPRPNKPESFVFIPPPPPKGKGAPSGRRQGGATRGDICKNYEGLTALVPFQDEVVRGLTASAKPTLWFYLPAPLASDLEAEFVLQDQDNNLVYRTDLDFNIDAPGIVPITVEAPDPSLKADTHYKWTMVIYCNPLRPSASVYVTGLLESVEHSLVPGLSTFEQAAQDAKDGIWFDSLTALAKLRQAEPDNPKLKQVWIELLQQIDLDDLVAMPLL